MLRYPESDQSVPAHYARAYAYHLGGYPDKAVAEADALLATNPHDPFFLELKGQILLEGGKPKEAIPILREATQRSNEAPMIAAMLGHALVATEDPKNFTEAKQILKVAVNRDNQDPFAWYQLGIIYDREGDLARASLATAERSNLESNPKLALASAEMAMKGIPPGSPDWLRAQDIAMVSKAELKQEEKGQKGPVTDTNAAPPKRGNLGSAIAGGLFGSAVTAALLVFAAPNYLEQPDRPAGPALGSAHPLRHGRCAARRAICARAGRKSRRDRNAVRKLVERAPPAAGHAGRILRLRLPLLQSEQPRISTACCSEDKGLRIVYRELPILGPDSLTAARVSLEASKAGRFRAIPRRPVGGRAARCGNDRDGGAVGRGGPGSAERPADRSRAQAQFHTRRPARSDGHATVRGRRQGAERRRRL